MHIATLDPAETDTPPDPHQERAERHARVLARLTEIGLSIAEAVERQALSQPDIPDAPAKAARAFATVSRAIRQTIALETQLADEAETTTRRLRAERTGFQQGLAQRNHLRRKRQVEKAVEALIEAKERAEPREDFSGLSMDLEDWLEDDDDFADLEGLSVGEIVLRICKDLEIEPDLSLWAEMPWAIEERRTRPKGSPFAAWPEATPEIATGPPG